MTDYYYFEDDVKIWGPRPLPRSDSHRSNLFNRTNEELLSFTTPEGVVKSYRPQIKIGHDAPYDSDTQVREWDGNSVITATDVTDTWIVRAMNQQEIDDLEASKNSRAEKRVASPELKMIYALIKGTVPSAVTNGDVDDFKQWYRSLL
jgi:hypothetical protein